MLLQSNASNGFKLKTRPAVVFVDEHKTGEEISNMQFGSRREFKEMEIHGKTKAQ